MADLISRDEGSKLMARVRKRNTSSRVRPTPQVVVAWTAVSIGGATPRVSDLVFRRPPVAVFVDGRFWQGCPVHGSIPKTNTAFWAANRNLAQNSKRDDRRRPSVGRPRLGDVTMRHEIHHDMEAIVERTARSVRDPFKRLR